MSCARPRRRQDVPTQSQTGWRLSLRKPVRSSAVRSGFKVDAIASSNFCGIPKTSSPLLITGSLLSLSRRSNAFHFTGGERPRCRLHGGRSLFNGIRRRHQLRLQRLRGPTCKLVMAPVWASLSGLVCPELPSGAPLVLSFYRSHIVASSEFRPPCACVLVCFVASVSAADARRSASPLRCRKQRILRPKWCQDRCCRC